MKKVVNNYISSIKKIFSDFRINLQRREIIKKNILMDEERKSILKFYDQKTWNDVYNHKDRISGSDLSFLSIKAIANFLPAYILFCLKEPNEADVLCDDLIELSKSKNFHRVLSYYTEDQKYLVKKIMDMLEPFLEEVKE